jgi:hypothetical protein
VPIFDRRGSTEVRNMDTVTSCLAFPKATVGYCATRYAGSKQSWPQFLKRCNAAHNRGGMRRTLHLLTPIY